MAGADGRGGRTEATAARARGEEGEVSTGTRAAQGGLLCCPGRRGSTGAVQRRGPGAARGGSRRRRPKAAENLGPWLGEAKDVEAALQRRGICPWSAEEEMAPVELQSAGNGEEQDFGEPFGPNTTLARRHAPWLLGRGVTAVV